MEGMTRVDAAEKEASEVLHSLLSVERIEKPEQVILVTTGSDDQEQTAFQGSTNATNGTTHESTEEHGNTGVQWHTPVSIGTQSLFTAINEANNHFPTAMDEQQVIWEGHTIQVSDGSQHIENLYSENNDIDINETNQKPKTTNLKSSTKKSMKKKVLLKKKRKPVVQNNEHTNNDPTKIEDSAQQVKERFRGGCECQDESCFRGLNPENVYRHRLNIAELTKAEHDMYLMGVTMACLANPDTTVRHKERRRLRAQYVYQGRRVCLDAFLYLENCTHYQLKRIRKHVMTHGVTPRVHGNHGKKPHNTFSLDIYRHATEFLKQYLETHTGETGITNSKQIIQLPWDITRKNLHDAYKEYGQIIEPGIKLMGYSTFRHFMKDQFPNVRFCKIEPKNAQNQQISDQQPGQQILQQIKQQPIEGRQRTDTILKSVVSNSSEVQQVIPLVVAQGNDGSSQHHQQAAFLVTPVPQLIQNGNIVTTQNAGSHVTSNFSYQLANTGYVAINEQGNIVTTMANGQHQTPYTFNRI